MARHSGGGKRTGARGGGLRRGRPSRRGAGASGRLATGLVLAGSLAAVGTYLAVAAARIGHPYELQWIEGAVADQVRRLLAGQPLYTAPSVDYTGLPYPPLFPWLAAAVARLVGGGFLAPRLVSLVASVACLALVALLVRRATGDWVGGAAAAGLFAAGFRLAGAWYDVARVDSLFLALLLAGLAVASRAEGRAGGAAAGALLALSFLAKQSALVVVLPVATYLVVRRRPAGGALAVAFATPVVVSTVALDVASDGWYRFFLAESLAGHPVVGSAWLDFWVRDLWRLVLVPALVVPAALVARRGRDELGTGFWLSSLGGLLACAWISRLHSGGYANVLMPAVAAAALAFGFAVHHLRHGPVWRRAGTVAAVLAQLALLSYDPRAQLPTSDDRDAGHRLVAALRAVDGDVFVVSHPWYGVLAGKPSTAHAAALGDVLRGDDRRLAARVRSQLADAVHTQRFAAIVFDETTGDRRGFPPDFERWYRHVPDPVFAPGSSGLVPVTDLKARPRSWWVPVTPPPARARP